MYNLICTVPPTPVAFWTGVAENKKFKELFNDEENLAEFYIGIVLILRAKIVRLHCVNIYMVKGSLYANAQYAKFHAINCGEQAEYGARTIKLLRCKPSNRTLYNGWYRSINNLNHLYYMI